MRSLFAFCCIFFAIIFSSTASGDDVFTRLVRDFRTSPCVMITFRHIITSDVFETVDTVEGELTFDSSGRFHLAVGGDIYIRNDSLQYSYSEETDQVIIERPKDDASLVSVLWIRHLDDYFNSVILSPNRKYKLSVKPDVSASVPDSLTVFLTGDKRLGRIEFIEESGETTVVIIDTQTLAKACKAGAFEPKFPDTAERVRL